ncbi:LPXTG-motif cell wall-anchored protein [Allocatelliglobosispora scoriae]|uniref:LPXTG-motif cell wall-anchored protein n=1 Tax=Allocatelliglobosispora scoriae TaxID=643052 RepID=A0A841C0S4_9ACTN|nr:prenyltransferase/squalene oxidase repeat-containing protein [Allocatelliglobosispora scoriae]MBB5872560.1 LPXTG-motif cell wall-anchored protein [Allocatelliglobosispora scoriae]
MLRPSLLPRGGARLAAVAAVAVLAFAGAAPAQAAPPTTDQPAAAAGGWLARQLVDGERFESDFGGGLVYPDQGLTLDAVLAFAAAGVAGDNADKALAWLADADTLAGYIGDGTDESYAGAHAKLMLAVQVQGKNPASFGGVDLDSRLRALMAASGRFVDKSAYGDYSNGFSQALAVLALDRTAAGVPAAAVTYLAGTQCADGGFPLYLEQPTCASDVDSTGMVVQALIAAGDSANATEGVEWLLTKQKADGGFGGSGPTSGENANSTGLAAQALRVAGRATAANKAVAYLTKLQVGCAGAVADRGGVAYDGTGFDAANANRATAQAILGLSGHGFAELDGAQAADAAPVLLCATASPSPSASVPASPSTSGSASPVPGEGGGLPVTGQPVALLIWSGAALVGIGAVAFVVGRRRRRLSEPAA